VVEGQLYPPPPFCSAAVTYPSINGTPFKSVLWRLLGVKIGRRLFDDGCAIIERTLVAVDDEATLNAGSTLHSHSMEDGTFKSDHVVIGAWSPTKPSWPARCHAPPSREGSLSRPLDRGRKLSSSFHLDHHRSGTRRRPKSSS